MKLTIFYYTGTGNSLWVARTLAKEFEGSELISIADRLKIRTAINSEIIGLVFPVHMWGLPSQVIRFVKELKTMPAEYIFALAVNAGQVANTLGQLNGLLKDNGLRLSSGFEIKMPSNYIPWGGPGTKELQESRFEAAKAKISRIARRIKAKEKRKFERGPLWQRLVFTLIYKVSFPHIKTMDRQFWVDEKCNQCGICSKVCPSQNITLEGGKPVWNHRCEQCFSCLQWCPQKAIQYGKKTPKYQRYHHPEIQLKDVLKSK